MSFFEEIAAALDAEGIESRVNDDVLFVPITADLEVQFIEIDPLLPAANVYIAAADVDEDDEQFEAVLVSVAFSVADALEAVARHIATDQVVTVLRDLLEGTDERIGELEFVQDEFNPNLVVADVATDSELRVLVETIDGVPSAVVRFLSFGTIEDEDDPELVAELENWDAEQSAEQPHADDADYAPGVRLFESEIDALHEEYGAQWSHLVDAPIIEFPAETLELGTYTDFDRLFDVLGLVAEQAHDWESQLIDFDYQDYEEPDVYDIFGADDLDADESDDEELAEDEDALDGEFDDEEYLEDLTYLADRDDDEDDDDDDLEFEELRPRNS